ncbi:MAG: NAD(P)/FAD-dependent oxidoreductase, partial [Mogibacterium sp.]|nr:NAD(P)/FAD-dependent oxidoreductase [Mogibacterium sp.]
HNIPGGATSSYRRGRFEIEVGVHFLTCVGTPENPGPLRKAFDELGVTDKFEMRLQDTMYRQIIPGVVDITIPTSKEALKAECKRQFPEESEALDKFFEIVYGIWDDHCRLTNNFCWDQVRSPYDKIDPEATPEKYPYYYKYAYQNVEEFMGKMFKSRALASVLSAFTMFTGPASIACMMDLTYWLFTIMEYKPAVPVHNTMVLTDAVVEQFIKHGGEIHCNAPVTEIVIEDGRAVGVKLEDGTEYRAKVVVADFSPLLAFENMIDKKKLAPEVVAEMNKAISNKTVKDGVINAYIGLDCDVKDLGVDEHLTFLVNQKISNRFVMMDCPGFDNPGHDVPGTSLVTLATYSRFGEWVGVPPEQYVDYKWAIADEMIKVVEASYPGFREHIEEMETSSLVTTCRFTESPAGTSAGFLSNHAGYFLNPVNYDCVDGLMFVGEWANNPGSVQPCYSRGVAVGRYLAETLK